MEQHAMFVRGERVSSIAIMSVRGILDVFIHHGTVTVNGDTFYEKHLIPLLQPFNGTNSHIIIIVLSF